MSCVPFMVHIIIELITMREQEFNKLLDKYLDGSISDKEKELLEKFKEKLKSLNQELPFENEARKNEIKEELWVGISSQKQNSKPKKSPNWKVPAAAAIFICLIAASYFYQRITTLTTPQTILENAISLQLEDGTIKLIKEGETGNITDTNGTILGQQKGNQLVYEEISSKKELVYNILKVPYGKTFQLKLSDGTIAHLNAGSSLKYPVQFLEGMKRQVFITGEAYLDVAKDAEHPFIVNAANLNVMVLGTQFNVSAYPEDETAEVVLVEGAVSLYSEADGYNAKKNTLLAPGFKGSYNKVENSIAKNEVVTSLYTSWINGKLVFRNMTFGNILKKLERHYDVTIINNNTELSKKVFNANFGKEPIENVLNELKANYGIVYHITEDKIVIQPNSKSYKTEKKSTRMK